MAQRVPPAAASPTPAAVLDSYVTSVARAWEPLMTPDGQVIDPLDPADSGDNYGVIMLADVMLRAAARHGDMALAEAGERIVVKTASLPSLTGPFNLLAVASLWRDGQLGRFPADAWGRLSLSVRTLAERIERPNGDGCWTTPGCYTNWRLVWAAGASELLAAGITPRTGEGASAAAATGEIHRDLALAVRYAGTPASPSPLQGAQELSDPASEPPSYALFSSALLELIAEADPSAITPAVARLREQAAHYDLLLMAPDGQLSYTGRSLDQSWVQAAGALLGSRQAVVDPAHAGGWRSFGDRALAYLAGAYPSRSDGIVPIVPGLLTNWSPSIVDNYAALDQYEGLTLWFLSEALDSWPEVTAARAPLPVDASDFLVGDLRSSGLVWGRAGSVWWALSGHTTAHDSRSTQGLVAVKFNTATGWRDLTALRPLGARQASVWTLRLPGGRQAVPVFTSVHGDGALAALDGSYWGSNTARLGPVHWSIDALPRDIRLSMSKPARTALRTTIWTAPAGAVVSGEHGAASPGRCVVTASGTGCPVSLAWRGGTSSSLVLGSLMMR